MRTLNISISDLEFSKFGIKKDNLSFSELLDLVSNELTRRALNESVEMAGKHGLSGMTMSEITKEVKASRIDAKDNS